MRAALRASTPKRTLSPCQPVLTKLHCAWAGWGDGAGLRTPPAAAGAGTAGLGGTWGGGLDWAVVGGRLAVITGRAGLASGILGHQGQCDTRMARGSEGGRPRPCPCGDWCPHPRSWTRGATGLHLQAGRGGGTGGWSVSPEGLAGGWGRVVAGGTTSPALRVVEVRGLLCRSPGVSPVVVRLGVFLCICDVCISCPIFISGLFFSFLE